MTYTPKNLPAWKHRVDLFNAGSNQPPVTVDQFIQAHLDEEESRHAAALETHQRNQLASNDALVELGTRVAAAPPEKQAAVFAAVEKALA